MKRSKFKYMVSIKWSEKDGAYVAEVPELPGCATHGRTYTEAIRHAEEAIDTWIDGAKESGYPIPEPLAYKKFSGKFVTRIDPSLHRDLALKAKERGKTLNGLVQEMIEKNL